MMQSPSQHQSSYYAVLGVHPGASSAEIRAAYHRLAMRWHPDKIANGRVDPAIAEEAKGRFQKIHEAYQGTCRAAQFSSLYVCSI
uniref:J domain-containing protein n=1 Tax=Triticum urartu TaxID=4572 RepID=A0A8R7PRZ8_TRIUA